VQAAGGTVKSGKEVVGLIKEGRVVRGVRLGDGTEELGDLVLVSPSIGCIYFSTDEADYSRSLVS
jgi:hypothetical protein